MPDFKFRSSIKSNDSVVFCDGSTCLLLLPFNLLFLKSHCMLHFKNDIFNGDRLLLTFCGFVRSFAQIPHSMDGNDNGFVDLFMAH